MKHLGVPQLRGEDGIEALLRRGEEAVTQLVQFAQDTGARSALAIALAGVAQACAQARADETNRRVERERQIAQRFAPREIFGDAGDVEAVAEAGQRQFAVVGRGECLQQAVGITVDAAARQRQQLSAPQDRRIERYPHAPSPMPGSG